MQTDPEEIKKAMLKEMEGTSEEAIINMAKMFNVPIASCLNVSEKHLLKANKKRQK